MGYHQKREDLSCFPRKSNVTAGKLLAVLCVAIQYVGGGRMEGRTREKKFWGANQNCLGARSPPAGLAKVAWEVWMCTLPLCTSFDPKDPILPLEPAQDRLAPRMKSGFPPHGPPHKRNGADYKPQNRRVSMLGGSFLLKRQKFSTDEKHMNFFSSSF